MNSSFPPGEFKVLKLHLNTSDDDKSSLTSSDSKKTIFQSQKNLSLRTRLMEKNSTLPSR
jgi:hypothetical protein